MVTLCNFVRGGPGFDPDGGRIFSDFPESENSAVAVPTAT